MPNLHILYSVRIHKLIRADIQNFYSRSHSYYFHNIKIALNFNVRIIYNIRNHQTASYN